MIDIGGGGFRLNIRNVVNMSSLFSGCIQLSDIFLASALFICYNDLFTKNELDLIPNVIRNFKFVSNMKLFKSVFGEAIPCKKVKKHEPFKENKDNNNNNNKKIK